MGDEEDPPIVLGRPFLNTTRAIIYIRTGEIHFQFRTGKVRYYFNTYANRKKPRKNKTRRRLQRLQRKLNTKLTNVKNMEEEIKEKSLSFYQPSILNLLFQKGLHRRNKFGGRKIKVHLRKTNH
jgi:hypothetical protein